ncbi:MAG: double-strand break repair helicase AddA [Sandarakinorhabdus sp.]|nr:double-strand break repair helicase AddA [Sandarakinorhabdus sp.]
MTTGITKALDPLKTDQANAAEPGVHAWVTASAGTGKTQVLSARVLRLLLQGTPPHAILCLTFTKLAAAEMQNRVFQRLAFWARCDAATLAADLRALRAGDDAEMLGRARRLFAQVLDAPQGLAVQTIHAFAQGLIAGFPVEAGVAPGFATLDDRAGAVLRRRLLAEAIERADIEGDAGFLEDLAEISIASGEMKLAAVAARLGVHAEALSGIPLAGIEPMLRRGFGLATDGDAASALAAAMARFDAVGVTRLAKAFGDDGGKTALAPPDRAAAWLGASDRAAAFDLLCRFFLTGKDEPRSEKAVPASAHKADPALRPLFLTLAEAVVSIIAEQRLYAAAAHAACHLRIGKRLAADWRAAKARLGVVDYDDMIAAAERLLLAPGAAEWVRYKLDQRIDHVLVDEAQDTNARQWRVGEALSREFFDGEGARDIQRTLFVVGDFKQAIFSFQGSNPQIYRDQRDIFQQWADDGRELWRNIPLVTNFRSVAAVLAVVDAVADEVGPGTLDQEGVPRHRPHRSEGEGAVTLWPSVQGAVIDSDDDNDDEAADSDDGGEARYAPKAEIRLAHQIAATIAGWLDPRDPLVLPARGRRVAPEDILVLVRSRSAFSGALVAALHEHQIPTAGADRMKRSDPLAVADLLALARFALQPGDDLTLAALLVSPFLGLDHDQLFTLADARPGNLWDRVRASTDPAVVAAREWLGLVLGFADFAAPYEFFERILSDERLGGRAKLLQRLGAEARDAIDAILDQALAFEAANAPSLQGFLAWIDADDLEIKRDPDAPLDAIRLMTVHGAKGLQAPVVILADAPRARKTRDEAPLLMQFDNGPVLPVFLASRKGLAGPVADAIDAADEDAAREHCRLMYVALTRAEDLLFIGGALSGKAIEVPEDSWYATIERALVALDAEFVPDRDGVGESLVYRVGTPVPRIDLETALRPDDALSLPAWATRAPDPEARPPRPLSPSAIAADDVSAPPSGPAAKAAARRGSALHALFERLPDIAADRRRGVGEAWCRMAVPELDAEALVKTVLAVLDDPTFADVFAAGALAEAPVAATVGGIVIAGKVDRLLVTETAVTIIDFKTGRRVPADAAAVEPYYLRQMAAYVAALERVFPGRQVAAALLYTEGPRLIALPDALIALHRPKDDLWLNPGGPAPIS